jgi:hypothetical protein
MGAVFAAPVQRHKLTGRGFQYLRSLHSLFIGETGKAHVQCTFAVRRTYLERHRFINEAVLDGSLKEQVRSAHAGH